MIDFLLNNTVARLAFLGLLFAFTIWGVVGLGRMSSRRMDTRAGIKEISLGPKGREGLTIQDKRTNAWAKLAERIETAGLNLSDTKSDSMREKMVAAGYTSPSAPKVFTLVRIILIFALPLGYIAVQRATGEPITTMKLYGYGLGLAVAGLYLPNIFIRAKADRRRETITNGFPDCLDLMLVCVEAGLGLESAMDRVGREMVGSHPLVAEILSRTTLQIRAGSQRDEALRRMGQDAGVAEIKSFSTLLIQSDKLGTSIAETLRIYAAEMREKRRLRAEERAHRLPVLLSIPLVLCLLPTMIGVLMLPGAVRVVRTLIPALGG